MRAELWFLARGNFRRGLSYIVFVVHVTWWRNRNDIIGNDLIEMACDWLEMVKENGGLDQREGNRPEIAMKSQGNRPEIARKSHGNRKVGLTRGWPPTGVNRTRACHFPTWVGVCPEGCPACRNLETKFWDRSYYLSCLDSSNMWISL